MVEGLSIRMPRFLYFFFQTSEISFFTLLTVYSSFLSLLVSFYLIMELESVHKLPFSQTLREKRNV